RTLTSQNKQSQTVPATGQETTPATNASGTAIIENRGDYPLHLDPGTVLTNTKGCIARELQVRLDTDTDVRATSSKIVPVNVFQPGTVGNIQDCKGGKLAFITYFCDRLKNWKASSHGFAGGTDPQTFTFVQQRDIDSAANSLKTATHQIALAAIKSQLQPN